MNQYQRRLKRIARIRQYWGLLPKIPQYTPTSLIVNRLLGCPIRGKRLAMIRRYFDRVQLLRKALSQFKAHKSRLKGLGLPANGSNKTDTPPTTITLETLRTSAGIFNRVGSFA